MKQKKYNIDNKKIFTVKPNYTPGTNTTDAKAIKFYYREILKNKLLKYDEQLMDEIIKRRLEILKNRLSMDITLTGQNGLIATIQTNRILIEAGQTAVNYWYQQTIDPSNFQEKLNQYKQHINQWTPGTTTGQIHTIKPQTVKNIQITHLFL